MHLDITIMLRRESYSSTRWSAFDPACRTAETFVDGWVRTGDEVVIQDGQVYIVDRLKVYFLHLPKFFCLSIVNRKS